MKIVIEGVGKLHIKCCNLNGRYSLFVLEKLLESKKSCINMCGQAFNNQR